LKLLRLQHQDLIQNTNIKEQLEAIQEECTEEIRRLNCLLAEQRGENELKLANTEKEKALLEQQVERMSSELAKQRESLA